MQWIFRRFSSFSPAVVAGCCLAGALALTIPLPSASAAEGPFAGFAGSWTGTGTLRPSNSQAERIRCNANYRPRGSTEHEVELQLRCASDSYHFDLSGDFTADDNNQITGRWTERSRNIGGTAVGSAHGERLHIHVEASGFAADLVMLTRNRRQSVTIDSQGGGQIVKVSISLSWS